MALQKIVSTTPLAQSKCQSLSPATADLIVSLAGRVRYLYELATGAAAYSDTVATPPNPQGMVGVDMSGPPWGPAIEHPLWSAESAIDNASLFGELSVLKTDTLNERKRILASIYVRPFQVGGANGEQAPYSRGYLRFEAVRTSATTNGAVAVNLYHGPDNSFGSTTTTLTCTSQTVPNISTAIYTKLSPGYNYRLIEFKQTSATGAGIDIRSIAINQTVRISH